MSGIDYWRSVDEAGRYLTEGMIKSYLGSAVYAMSGQINDVGCNKESIREIVDDYFSSAMTNRGDRQIVIYISPHCSAWEAPVTRSRAKDEKEALVCVGTHASDAKYKWMYRDSSAMGKWKKTNRCPVDEDFLATAIRKDFFYNHRSEIRDALCLEGYEYRKK